MTVKTTRLLLGAGVPAAAAAIGLIPYLTFRSDLPDRLATHFSASGTPDGSMTHTGLLLATGGLGAIGIAMLVAISAGRPEKLQPQMGVFVGFLGAFLAGLGAMILATTAITQRNITGWTEADSPWFSLLAILAVAALLGAVAARLGMRLPGADPCGTQMGDLPMMDLATDEHAVWSRRLHSTVLVIVALAAVGLGLLVAAATMWWIAIPTVIVGIAVLALTAIRVRVDRTGLHIGYGVLPWPSQHIPID